MIKIHIDRHPVNGFIRSFSVKGHAQYAEFGQDIVCAAISAVTVGTVNAIEELLGVVPDSRMQDGFLQAGIPETLPESQAGQVQLLLESMVVMLETIEASYGSYIQMKQSEPRRR